MVATNSAGSVTGAVWTFSTRAAIAPDAPVAPSPTNGTVNVSGATNLSWQAANGADGYEVYLWVTSAGEPASPSATTNATRWDPPGDLTADTAYSWKVVATNLYGRTTGAVWTFTTIPVMPGVPSLAAPTNGAPAEPASISLYWTAAARATGYEVYLWADSESEPASPTATAASPVWYPGGLTPKQLAAIGFVNPAGKERGTYSAQLGKDKQLEIGAAVVPVNPPYDLSEKGRAERKALYDIPGLASLTGKATPLKAGMKIVAFGDSITMQGRYITMMGDALSKGEGTKGLGVQLVRYGLNGGRVPDLLAGKSLKGDFKATLEELVQKEKPDAVSIWIGVNDVWFGEKGTTPEAFEAGLRKMVALCRAANAKVVLAPVAVLKEDAGHWNPKCDQYAEITRKVARETGSALADLRQAFVAYTRNHGYDVLPDGALRYEGTVLAFDGVHINDTGAAIAANLISQAVCEALKN